MSSSTRIPAEASGAVSSRVAVGGGGFCTATAAATSCASRSEVVSKIAAESSPCSACDSKSAATNAAGAVSSAITNTSEGPGGQSMASGSPALAAQILAATT